MSEPIVNVLLSSSPALGGPSTLVINSPACATIEEVIGQFLARLPRVPNRYTFSTTSGKNLNVAGGALVSSLLPGRSHGFIPIRLSVPLPGGKGGFGSQLRAAGGRMSTKKKKRQGDDNGSSRNLDGRRLRTITEAKSLAEFLAGKPNEERKRKEARRKRWEQIVELSQDRDEELRNGRKGRVDEKWIDDKEEAGERTRTAVKSAIEAGQRMTVSPRHEMDVSKRASGSGVIASEDAHIQRELYAQAEEASPQPRQFDGGEKFRSYSGFDEDQDYMSDDEIVQG